MSQQSVGVCLAWERPGLEGMFPCQEAAVGLFCIAAESRVVGGSGSWHGPPINEGEPSVFAV